MITTKAELEELFLRRKPVKLLMALRLHPSSAYISTLSKETDCTYSHTVKLLEEFHALGLVEFEKSGRVKYIKLTPDGEELATNFEAVLRKFSKLQPKIEKRPPAPYLAKRAEKGIAQ
ncbi:MAG: winged helix DNA-binding protein [Candidatus Aenigmatarchaeota archaeon]